MSKNTINISNYGNSIYSSNNYGAHTIKIDLNNISFYFSYKTIIAFTINGTTTCCKNSWGPTTGRHLNLIQDKALRIPYEEFQQKLSKVLKNIGTINIV